ncbi:MAG TPA: terminase large subunit [Dongiaceae bacterium]|nr:terminase large subunit [Dongiaceae bacterium]
MGAWLTACPDWEQRFLCGQTLVPDLPLFTEEAAKALRVYKRLRVPDMHGKPTLGEVSGPWVFPIVEAIFGSYDPDNNVRMIQEFFWVIPKKNGKSSSAAAIMVEALILNRRPEGEYILVAPTKGVADIVFLQASGTIRADPELEKLFQLQPHIRKITHRRTGATLQVKAADTDVITGGKQVGTLIDETHVFADKAAAAEIFIEIRGAMAARPDGFLIQITTQSKSPPAGVFKAELTRARDVRDGKLILPLLPIIYELPQSLGREAWKDERYWSLINPNLNRSVSLDFLRRELESAERQGAAQLALFASQHFDVEIGIGLQTDRWAGADYWEQRADTSLTLNELLDRSEVVTVGIDGGGLDDLLGLAVLGREKKTRRWLLWTHAWAHPIVLERRKEIAPRLLDFEKDGDLTLVGEIGQDVIGVCSIIEIIERRGLLPEKEGIGVDRAGITEIVDALARRGFSADQGGMIVAVQQGWALTPTIKTAERQLAGPYFAHSGSRLMDWCVGNAKVEPKGNAILITKQVSGSAKIDPLMATFDAVACMALNPEAAGAFIYNERDAIILA